MKRLFCILASLFAMIAIEAAEPEVTIYLNESGQKVTNAKLAAMKGYLSGSEETGYDFRVFSAADSPKTPLAHLHYASYTDTLQVMDGLQLYYDAAGDLNISALYQQGQLIRKSYYQKGVCVVSLPLQQGDTLYRTSLYTNYKDPKANFTFALSPSCKAYGVVTHGGRLPRVRWYNMEDRQLVEQNTYSEVYPTLKYLRAQNRFEPMGQRQYVFDGEGKVSLWVYSDTLLQVVWSLQQLEDKSYLVKLRDAQTDSLKELAIGGRTEAEKLNETLQALHSGSAAFWQEIWTPKYKCDDAGIYAEVEQAPQFPGGEEQLALYIKKNLKYPAFAAENGIQGRVTLSFVVEKDGSIANIEVMRTPAEELSKEAIRLVSTMPKWEPGRVDGEPVRVRFVLPVTFRLNGGRVSTSRESLNIPTREVRMLF